MPETPIHDMQLWGEERGQALAEMNRLVADWGLSLPDTEPLVLQFGLNDFRNTGLIEYWVFNDESVGYCGKFLFVFDGQSCPCHHHDVKHETFFVVTGKVSMTVDGEQRVMEPGDTLVMPPGADHTFAGIGPALLLEVSLPSTRGDNLFADKLIGKHGVI